MCWSTNLEIVVEPDEVPDGAEETKVEEPGGKEQKWSQSTPLPNMTKVPSRLDKS
jgi:hypothetical protein